MTSIIAKGDTSPLDITQSGNQRLHVGLSWDIAERIIETGFIIKKSKKITMTFDLDLFCCLYDKSQNFIEHVAPESEHLIDSSEQIFHSGDNTTGRIGGDDEYISLNMAHLKANVDSVVFCVIANEGKTFDEVENVECRVADGATDANRLYLAVNDQPECQTNALVFAKITRVPNTDDWTLSNISDFKNRINVDDWSEELKKYL